MMWTLNRRPTPKKLERSRHCDYLDWHMTKQTVQHSEALTVANPGLLAAHSLCGRRGTWWHRRPCCVAGVALGDIDLRTAFLMRTFFFGRGIALERTRFPKCCACQLIWCLFRWWWHDDMQHFVFQSDGKMALFQSDALIVLSQPPSVSVISRAWEHCTKMFKRHARFFPCTYGISTLMILMGKSRISNAPHQGVQ